MVINLLVVRRRFSRWRSGGGRGRGERYSHRNRPRNDVFLRRSLQRRKSRYHSERPRESNHAVVGGVHRHRAADRRSRQEPGAFKPGAHHLRRQEAHRKEVSPTIKSAGTDLPSFEFWRENP